MSLQVTAINGKGSALDSLSGAVTSTGLDAADILYFPNDFMDGAGYIEGIGSGVQVVEHSPVNMSVDVGTGVAYVLNSTATRTSATEPYLFRVNIDAVENPTITANASGFDRIDLVALKIDKVTAPNDDADNVATIEVIAGTPSATPTAPALPADHLALAEVYVINGASSISNSDISDLRVASKINASAITIPYELENNESLEGKDNGGTLRNIVKVDANNILEIGDANLAGINKYPQLVSIVDLAADQAGVRGTPFKVDFDSVIQDPAGLFNVTTKRFEITTATEGYYLINARTGLVGDFTNDAITIYIYVNGTARAQVHRRNDSNFPNEGFDITDIRSLLAGDYVELYLSVAGVGAYTISNLQILTSFQIAKLY